MLRNKTSSFLIDITVVTLESHHYSKDAYIQNITTTNADVGLDILVDNQLHPLKQAEKEQLYHLQRKDKKIMLRL